VIRSDNSLRNAGMVAILTFLVGLNRKMSGKRRVFCPSISLQGDLLSIQSGPIRRCTKPNSKAIAELAVEMAKPRFVASVRDEVGVFSSFKGIFARVARKLNLSPSMVSKVANGHRVSPKTKKALLEELEEIKQKLDRVAGELY
jgi:hypothetical protein